MLRHYINMSCRDDEPDAGARQLLGGKPGPKLPPKSRAGGGTSPLHLASCRGHVGVVHELLSAGADATRGDQFGYSALHLAAKHGFPDVITEMLSFSAVDANLLDENGETALHTAARYSKTLCLSRLLQNGGDLSIRSRSGRTPMDVVGQPQDKHGRQSMPHSATQLAGTGGCRRSHKFNTNLPPPQLPRDRCTEERIRRLLRAAAGGGEDGWMWPAAGAAAASADAVGESIGGERDRAIGDTAESAADCAAGAYAKPRERTVGWKRHSHSHSAAAPAAAAGAAAAVGERPFGSVNASGTPSSEREKREIMAGGEARPSRNEGTFSAAAAAAAAAASDPTPTKITVAERTHVNAPILLTATAADASGRGGGGGVPTGADAAGGEIKSPASPHCSTRSGHSSGDSDNNLCTRGAAAAVLHDSADKMRAANGCVRILENGLADAGSNGSGAVVGAGDGAAPGPLPAKRRLPLGRLDMRRLRKGRDGQGDVGVLTAINRYSHCTLPSIQAKSGTSS